MATAKNKTKVKEEDTIERESNMPRAEDLENEQTGIPVPPEYIQGYKNGLQRDEQLREEIARKSYEQTKIRERLLEIQEVLETTLKDVDRINKAREEVDRALKDLKTQMEDACKLDRNKNFALDLDNAVFVETEAQQ